MPKTTTFAKRPQGDEDAPFAKKVRWENSTTLSGEEDVLASNNDGEGEEEESSNDTLKACLAAHCQQLRIGAAYYDRVRCTLCVLEDTEDSTHFDLMRTVLDHVDPDLTLTSSRADDVFVDLLRDHMDTTKGIFDLRPHKEFQPARGKQRVLSLRLLSDSPHHDDRKNGWGETDPTMRTWSAAIRLANFVASEKSPLCMASVGALLDHLVRERAVGALEDEGLDGLEIRDIELLSLEQVMQVNADALLSLNVFEGESHASIHSEKTKEGLSLFSTLDYTKTALGRSLLRTWLLRPSLSLATISARHAAVACFVDPQNFAVTGTMHTHLKGIKNVPKIFGAMRGGKGKLADWQAVVKFTFHSAMLRDALNDIYHGEGVEVIAKLIEAIDVGQFKEVGMIINDTIDWEESTLAGRICVRPHIDEELDHRKHVYSGMDDVLSAVALQISQTVAVEYASCLNVVYFPQLGFLICTPRLDNESERTMPDGWTFQFSTDTNLYFKSEEMKHMDQHIGDLHSLIVDREIEIIQSLLERVLFIEEAINHACDVCAELDCLLSLAEAARVGHYRRPEMVEEDDIEIKQGRHPLQEQVVNVFVPNDAHLVGGGFSGHPESKWDEDGRKVTQQRNRILLCTGANACGKSVYLKQVALIQFMAQIGSFVPAEFARLGIIDKIFTRIRTRESVSKVQSAFMIDLSQVSLALRNATSRSLIILDEFGKGTHSADGAGLLCGILNSLIERGPECPKVLVATHFHEVFRREILDPELAPITFMHMQVMFTADRGSEGQVDTQDGKGPEGRITYLYRATAGLSFASHAAKCMRTFGIPAKLAERAEHISYLVSMHELGSLRNEHLTDAETVELEACEDVCRRFLAWNEHGDDGNNIREKLREVLGR